MDRVMGGTNGTVFAGTHSNVTAEEENMRATAGDRERQAF